MSTGRWRVSGIAFVPVRAEVTVEAANEEEALVKAHAAWAANKRELIVGNSEDEAAAFDWQPTAEPAALEPQPGFIASVEYVRTAPAFAADLEGHVWTRNRSAAYVFSSVTAATILAERQAKASRGSAMVIPGGGVSEAAA